MDEISLLIICGSGAVGLLAMFVVQALTGRKDDRLRGRLTGRSRGGEQLPPGFAAGRGGFVPLLQRMGQAASKPFMPKNRDRQAGMRKKLAEAGVYAPSAVRVMTGFKLILLGLGLLTGYGVGRALGNAWMGVALGGLLGYVAPVVWLRTRIKSNQRQLTYGLADALDLMVVCVEAGLTVDAAMQRVGQEMAIAHPAISREFSIAHMETRVGLSRAESMKNLGVRTGNQPLQSLAAMLVQAERFGTSIGQALRIYSETLRTNRQHQAEEQAAKASVKISFPLVLFIFPATFIILAGPTIIRLMASDFMK